MAPKQSKPSKPTARKKTKHDVALLIQAVESVSSKSMGLRKAAKHYGIPVTTLADKVRGKTPIECVPHTLLTKYEEERLAQWLKKMSELAFGQTTDDIGAMPKAILELRGGTTKDPSNLPSTAWVYRFFERHPDLTLRTPMSLGKERIFVTSRNVDKWFEDMRKYIISQDEDLLNDPNRIFNADESWFSFDPKARKVIACKGAKHVYAVSSNTKTHVTVLASMNAAGFYLKSLMIYPYKKLPGRELMDGFPEANIQISDNGWITSGIFFTWLRDSYIPETEHIARPRTPGMTGRIQQHSSEATVVVCRWPCEP